MWRTSLRHAPGWRGKEENKMEVRGQAVRQIERLTMRRRTRCEGVLGERTQDQGGYPQLDDVQRTQREKG